MIRRFNKELEKVQGANPAKYLILKRRIIATKLQKQTIQKQVKRNIFLFLYIFNRKT